MDDFRQRLRDTLRRGINRARVSPNPMMRAGVDFAQWGFRMVGWAFPWLSLGWVSALRSARWDGDDLVLTGWGYVRGATYGPAPELGATLGSIGADTRHVEDVDVLGAAQRAEMDYRGNTWEARFSAADLARLRGGATPLRATAKGNGRRSRGPVKLVYTFGTPATVPARVINGRVVALRPKPNGGVDVTVRPARARVTDVVVAARSLTVTLADGDVPSEPVLKGRSQKKAVLAAERVGEAVLLTGTLPAGKSVVDTLTATRYPPAWRLSLGPDVEPPWLPADVVHRPTKHGELFVRPAQDGSLEVVDVPFFVEADGVENDGDSLRITGWMAGSAHGSRADGFSLVLAAPRMDLPVTIESVGADGRFTASAALHASRWGGPALPPLRGVYVLEGRRDDAVGDAARFATFASASYVDRVPTVISRDDVQLRLEVNRQAQVAVRVNRPRRVDEYGSHNQKQLFNEYGLAPTESLDAVYFESFFGRSATCNPAAIDAAVARSRPDLPRYWSVDDFSVAVPEGAIPLVIGSREWWRVRESARWIVTNEWLRGRYVKKDHQTVLQTWHGSMYKRIGLDRGKTGFIAGGHVDRARNERANWDMFISQNSDTTPIITRAYEFEAEPNAVLEIGYPRNDELATADAARSKAVRDLLGVPEGDVVVMYAPTWREVGQQVELLNVVALAQQLGSGFTFLQRGHVRTLKEGETLSGGTVIDVSTYPHINDLFFASDVLITDYSSMMFDFSVTGRPMLFYTPDIDEYTDPRVRGSYFDLEEIAPGPVVREADEVVGLLRTIAQWRPEYDDRYAAWKQRFNHLDDGHASDRAVEALFAFDPSTRVRSTRRRLFDPAAGEDA